MRISIFLASAAILVISNSRLAPASHIFSTNARVNGVALDNGAATNPTLQTVVGTTVTFSFDLFSTSSSFSDNFNVAFGASGGSLSAPADFSTFYDGSGTLATPVNVSFTHTFTALGNYIGGLTPDLPASAPDYRFVGGATAFQPFLPFTIDVLPVTTVPTDLNVGDKYRLAFVTSTKTDATSTDIADYNAFVSGVASLEPELAALGTTWTAIASTATVDARDNTGTNPSSTGVPIYRLDDTRIADDNADLWDGTLAAQLSTLETGVTNTGINPWTGTSASGIAQNPLGASLPQVGSAALTNSGWIAFNNPFGSGSDLSLYAMSGELTVVPEPSSLILVCVGATTMVGWQLRGRRHRKACRNLKGAR